jgi:hypothetical protein
MTGTEGRTRLLCLLVAHSVHQPPVAAVAAATANRPPVRARIADRLFKHARTPANGDLTPSADRA